jgi:hypothetical protein
MFGIKGRSGRKHKTELQDSVAVILTYTAPRAARLLRDYIEGKIKIDSLQLDAIKYVINQAIGAPRQRQEIIEDNKLDIIVTYVPRPDYQELPNTSLTAIEAPAFDTKED